MADDKNDPTYTPGKSLTKGKLKRNDSESVEVIPELQPAYKILQDIMYMSKFFLEKPSEKDRGMLDYYDVISSPMWFSEIQRKFVDEEYKNITEFVSDVRLLLLNCYRYFGPDDIRSKRAQRVEEAFEKKISVLDEEIREKCSLEATNGKLEDDVEFDNLVKEKNLGDIESKLLRSVAGEKYRRDTERRKQLCSIRQAENRGSENEIQWEKETLFTNNDQQQMKYMWELPVIAHFIALAYEQLNVDKISIYEVERMFLMPQASKSLAKLMTTLLSTPLTRLKLHTKPPMPYSVWNKKLGHRVSAWYKLYTKSNRNPQVVFEKLGIEHHFWKILGDINPLEDYQFHELTFHQRAVLVKTFCDYIMLNHRCIHECLSEKVDQYGTLLGEDRSGARYIYFPEFLDTDIRVYKQHSDPLTWVERDKAHEELKKKLEEREAARKKSNSPQSGKKLKYRRKKSWSHGEIKKIKKKTHKPESCKERSPIKCVISLKQTSRENEGMLMECNDVQIKEEKSEVTSSESATNLDQTQISSNEDTLTVPLSVKSEKVNACDTEDSGVGDSDRGETRHESFEKLKPLTLVREKNEYVMKVSVESDKKDNVAAEVKVEKLPLYTAPWLEPDPLDFELVADSVEGVRKLLDKFCDDDLDLIERLKQMKAGKTNRPNCEMKLSRKLAILISNLEPVELKVILNLKTSRQKLFNEWQEFSNRPSDFIDADEAFWLSEKETVETQENEILDTTPLKQNESGLDEVDLPRPPSAANSESSVTGGRNLRQRRVEDSLTKDLTRLDSSEESESSEDSDSDTWVMPKNRKRRKPKMPKALCPASQNKKKKQMPEKQEVDTKNLEKQCESNISSATEIPDTAPPKVASTSILRVKKNLFPPGSEPNEQLDWEKNRQKLILREMSKIYLDTSGVITVPESNTNEALTPLQGRKLEEVIKNGKVIKDTNVIRKVLNVVEIGKKGTQQQNSSACYAVSNNAGDFTQPSLNKIAIMHQKDRSDLRRVNVYSNATQKKSVQCTSLQASKPTPSANAKSTTDEVVCISDDSDSEVEFLDEVYNPKLDSKLLTKKQPKRKSTFQDKGTVPGNTVSNVMNMPPKSVVQMNVNISSPPLAVRESISSPGLVISQRNGSVTTPIAVSVGRGEQKNVKTCSQVVVASSLQMSTNLQKQVLNSSPTSVQMPSGNTVVRRLLVQKTGTVTQYFSPRTPSASSGGQMISVCTAASTQQCILRASSQPNQAQPARVFPMSPTSPVMYSASMRSPLIATSPSNVRVHPNTPFIPIAERLPVTPLQQVTSSTIVSPRLRSPTTNLSSRMLTVTSNMSPRFPTTPSNMPPRLLTTSSIISPRQLTTSSIISPRQLTTPSNMSPRLRMSPSGTSPRQLTSPVLQPLAQISSPRTPVQQVRQIRPTRNSGDDTQRLNQASARLVVIPGDENTGSNYALALPDGTRIILTPQQVADIRAGNGGYLTTNVKL